MIKIATSQNLTEIEFFHSLLQEQGIDCIVKNQSVGILRGEIPFTGYSPELWIMNDEDLIQAQTALQQSQSQEATATQTWTCPECGEEIEGQFTSCWNCGAEKLG